MSGKIILLNGASSSGKSTLARALQNALDEPFWHFSIDHLRESNVLPWQRIASNEFEWANLRPAFFEGFHRCLPELATAGNNLIVEHIIESEHYMVRLLNLLLGIDVFFVGIHCPLQELERREIARGDRKHGEARSDYERKHSYCRYDLEINSDESLSDNVQRVLSAWQRRQLPSAFDLMRSELSQSMQQQP